MKRISLLIILGLLLIVGTVSASYTITYNTTAATDGYTVRTTTGSSWADVRDGAGTAFSSDAANVLVDVDTHSTPNQWNYIHRGVLIFDTSGIPDDAWIESASISLYTQATSTAAGDVGIGITKFTVDGAISADDYDNYDITRFASDVNIGSLTSAGYHTWSLNSLGIANVSKTGNSPFSLMTQWDIDNSMTWGNDVRSYYSAYSCDESSCAYPPQLIVKYHVPPTPEFSASPTSGTTPLSVTFTDASSETPSNWDWYWYDNETKSSDAQNPTTTFTTGTYNVRLKAGNSGGLVYWKNKTAYITVTPPPTDVRIDSISSVTNKGATFAIAGAISTNPVYIGFGTTPTGNIWRSHNVTSSGTGTATVGLSGGTVRTNTLYYAHACQFVTGGTVCNSSYSTFTTSVVGTVNQTNYGSGISNMTTNDFDVMTMMPDLLTTYTNIIPVTVFFGLILGSITIGLWVANRSTRLVGALFIIVSVMLFGAGTGLNIGIPGQMQALGMVFLAAGIAAMLLSWIRRG